METSSQLKRSAPEAGDWDRIDHMPEFKELMAAKARFIVPTSIFFIVYYFALPALVGWAPKLMSTRVIGPVNLAYLFALSQFLVAWAIAITYMRVASRWDETARGILRKLKGGK